MEAIKRKNSHYYFQVKERLAGDIRKGRMKPGQPVPSENEIIRKFEVSSTTARRALNDLEIEGLIERIQGKGSFVAESKPELSAKEVVGLVMPTSYHIYESFSGSIIRGLMEHHLFPLTVDLIKDSKTGFPRTKILIEKQPSFLIFDTSTTEFSPDVLSKLSSYKGHIVFINRYEWPMNLSGSDVLSDMRKGGVLATEHLLAAGYHKIIHYTNIPTSVDKSIALVEDGIRFVLKKHNMPEDNLTHWNENEQSLKELLKREKMPAGLIANSDYRLKHIYKIAGELRLRIPEDLGLIGWYNTPWCETFRPHLTSISIREDKMAEKVIEIITHKEMWDKKILIPPELVIRDSTRRCD